MPTLYGVDLSQLLQNDWPRTCLDAGLSESTYLPWYLDQADRGPISLIRTWHAMSFNNAQEQAVPSGLDGMVEYSGETREWWESALGLSG